MEFNFSRDEYIVELTNCNVEFNRLAPDEAIFMTHYELAAATGQGDPELWKKFLTHASVQEWMAKEIELFKVSQYNKMIRRATTHDRSVGTAQMINALDKSLNKETTAEGPAFIYTYVPLATNQQQLPNVREETTDIFWSDNE